MSDAPTISLIMTCLNRQAYLAAAIESVLAQTYPHWSLEIRDDCSTDTSVQIAQAYADRDARITVVTTGENVGHAQQLAWGLADKTDPYLGWVDSDDLLAPTALAETVKLLEQQPDVGMVYTDHVDIDAQGNEHGLGFRCQYPYHHNLLLTQFICHHFRLIRRTAYDLVGGVDPNFFSGEDYDLCLKLSEQVKIVHLQQPLYFYRQHLDSASHLYQAKQFEIAKRVVDNALVRRGLADIYELVTTDGQFKLEPKQLT
jgi:glycosyltransferase involved in cell wall biosynthesis